MGKKIKEIVAIVAKFEKMKESKMVLALSCKDRVYPGIGTGIDALRIGIKSHLEIMCAEESSPDVLYVISYSILNERNSFICKDFVHYDSETNTIIFTKDNDDNLNE